MKVIFTKPLPDVDFLIEAFQYSDLGDFQKYITIDKDLFRPAEVQYLRGDSRKAKKHLGWIPDISFEQLVHGMVDADRNNIYV